MIAFGPIPSRRLGRSLGVNHIPPKVCTYSCVYCQLGRTKRLSNEPEAFFGPHEVLRDVRERLRAAAQQGESVDYITFVADGEPTLDACLGQTMSLLKPLGVPLAIITNASLIWRDSVRRALLQADWVSLKVDAVRSDLWRRIDRPHGSLRLEAIHRGMRHFRNSYDGILATETMLLRGVNDGVEHLRELARFLKTLAPDCAYLSIPTRTPAEPWVTLADEESITRAYRIVSDEVDRVECLTGYEGDVFTQVGDPQEDLLRITSVHPMRQSAVQAFLARADADWSLVDRMLSEGSLVRTHHAGATYYLRSFVR